MADELLKHYKHVSALGSGSFGAALLMRRIRDDMLVVAKEVRYANLKERDRRSALNEVDILQSLQHPNIVRYIEKFQDASTVYIVMEYCDQGDLAQKIAERKGVRFSEAEVLDYFAQLCLALRYLHENRILHRDLKSQNVFLTSDGAVKLGDFGISAVLRNTFELRMTVCGTPYYFSPELCQNKPYNNKSDIWALGCILYELLTLRRPFTGSNMTSLAQRIRKGEYVPIDGTHYSPILVKLVAAMLHTNPHERPTVSQIFGLQIMRSAVARLRARLDGASAAASLRNSNKSSISSSSNSNISSSSSNSNNSNISVSSSSNGSGKGVGHGGDDGAHDKSGERGVAVVAVAAQASQHGGKDTPLPLSSAAPPAPTPAPPLSQQASKVAGVPAGSSSSNNNNNNNNSSNNGTDAHKLHGVATASASASSSSSSSTTPHDAGGLTRKQREQLQRQFMQVAAYANGLTLEQFSALAADVQVRVVCAAINAQKAAVHAQWEQRAAAAQRERERELQQQQQQQQQQNVSSQSRQSHENGAAHSGGERLPSTPHADVISSSSNNSGRSSRRSHGSNGSAAVVNAPLPLSGVHDNNSSSDGASSSSSSNNSGSRGSINNNAGHAPPHATDLQKPPVLRVATRKPTAAQHGVATVAVPATTTGKHVDPHDARHVPEGHAPPPPPPPPPPPTTTATHASSMPLMHRIELLRVELERAMGEEQLSRCCQALRAQPRDAAPATVATSVQASWQRYVPLVQQLLAYEREFDSGGR